MSGESCVIQVTNIAPSTTKEQMKTLFSYVGHLDDMKLYPENDTIPVSSKVCYLKFDSPETAGIGLHLTNTVFIDRALIVVPIPDGFIPDETTAMRIAAPGSSIAGQLPANHTWPSDVINQIHGQLITTVDPRISQLNLAPYPPLSASTEPCKLDEVRRTLYVSNLDPTITGEKIINFFTQAGEVKYVRMAGEDILPSRAALVEMTHQISIHKALQLNGMECLGKKIIIQHSLNTIQKQPLPQANITVGGMNTREIEEAMKKVKDTQSLISAVVDSELEKKGFRSSSPSIKSKHRRSRSRSRTKRSRSRKKSRSPSRKRSRSRSRRSPVRKRRSRSRKRSLSRSRRRSRSRSPKNSRSRKRSRTPKKRRSRSRSRSRSDAIKKPEEGERDRRKRRSRSRGRRSRSRRRSRTKSPRSDAIKKPEEGERKRRRSRSRSKSRKHSRSRSLDKKVRSKSTSPSSPIIDKEGSVPPEKEKEEKERSKPRSESKRSEEKHRLELKKSEEKHRSVSKKSDEKHRRRSRTPRRSRSRSRPRRSRSRGRRSRSRSRSPRKLKLKKSEEKHRSKKKKVPTATLR